MPFDFSNFNRKRDDEPSNIYISHPFLINPEEPNFRVLEIPYRLLRLSMVENPTPSFFIPQFQLGGIIGLSREERVKKIRYMEHDDWVFLQYLPKKIRRFELINSGLVGILLEESEIAQSRDLNRVLVYENSDSPYLSSDPINSPDEIPDEVKKYFDNRTILPATAIFGDMKPNI